MLEVLRSFTTTKKVIFVREGEEMKVEENPLAMQVLICHFD